MKNWQDGENKRYFFILGREAHLAVAELISVLESLQYMYTVVGAGREVLILDLPRPLPEAVFNRLGGMIKFGECLLARPSLEALDNEAILAHFPKETEKILFGLSVYALEEMSSADVRKAKVVLDRRALGMKKQLKENTSRVRYVSTNEAALSSVAVLTNKLMREHGYEFVVLVGQAGVIFGQTIAVQNFSEFRHRDFGRPVRDPKRGTLPPKLARLLVNLSGVKNTDLLLDAFCGDGTILTEAMVLGFENLIGADIDKTAIAHTKKNTEWVLAEYRKKAVVRLFVSDVRALPALLNNERVQAVVSEGDLGAPLRERLSDVEAEKALRGATELYQAALRTLAGMVEHGGRIILALPHYPTARGGFGISFDSSMIHDLRLKQVNLWPEGVGRILGRFGQTGTYIYGREEQKVEREIFIFEKS